MKPEFWAGRKVLVTGHTGFKGAWLSAWLDQLGCKVTGLSLAPDDDPNLWSVLKLSDRVNNIIGDVRDRDVVARALDTEPEIVFHLAAQALVRRSYRDPVNTFSTNVTGTVELLHAVSQTPTVQSVVVVTSDKVYENTEGGQSFVETDRLGGFDPYSASKSACEIAVQSMRQSFFSPNGAGVATARAGNVIGGGDWSADRLVPDIVRGCLSGHGTVTLRAPASVRPWQHVLEPLYGYMILAERLYDDPAVFSREFNFGPNVGDERDVQSVAEGIVSSLKQGEIVHDVEPDAPKESKVLRLDSSLAIDQLGWRPVFDFEQTVSMTAGWYADWFEGADMRSVTSDQIQHYTIQAAGT